MPTKVITADVIFGLKDVLELLNRSKSMTKMYTSKEINMGERLITMFRRVWCMKVKYVGKQGVTVLV